MWQKGSVSKWHSDPATRELILATLVVNIVIAGSIGEYTLGGNVESQWTSVAGAMLQTGFNEDLFQYATSKKSALHNLVQEAFNITRIKNAVGDKRRMTIDEAVNAGRLSEREGTSIIEGIAWWDDNYPTPKDKAEAIEAFADEHAVQMERGQITLEQSVSNHQDEPGPAALAGNAVDQDELKTDREDAEDPLLK